MLNWKNKPSLDGEGVKEKEGSFYQAFKSQITSYSSEQDCGGTVEKGESFDSEISRFKLACQVLAEDSQANETAKLGVLVSVSKLTAILKVTDTQLA